jgi:hypothetical protein
MARHKRIDTSLKFLAVYPSHQLLPGTFENEVSVKAYASNANVKRSGRVMQETRSEPTSLQNMCNSINTFGVFLHFFLECFPVLLLRRHA